MSLVVGNPMILPDNSFILFTFPAADYYNIKHGRRADFKADTPSPVFPDLRALNGEDWGLGSDPAA